MKKTSTGFNLLIGTYYNNGWFRAGEPTFLTQKCEKCENDQLEKHPLKKLLFAFGRVIIKRKTLLVCCNCCHEVEVESKAVKKAQKKQLNTLIDRFKALSPLEQAKLLKAIGGKL